MSFLEGFLESTGGGSSGLASLENRRYAARQDKRAEDQAGRYAAQEEDRKKEFEQRYSQQDKTNKATNDDRALVEQQRANSALLSRLNTNNLLDSQNAFNIDGDKLRAGIESGDGATTELALDLLNQSGTFEDGVKAIAFEVIPGGGIAVTTRNEKGELGVGTSPANPDADGEVITLPAGKLGKIANTLYRGKIITGLPEDQRNAFGRYRGDMNVIELERQAIQAARDAGGPDMERDAIAAISEAETPEERAEAAQSVINVTAPQSAPTQQPSVSQPYDGPISFEDLENLGVTPEEYAAMPDETKAQVLSALNLKKGGRVLAAPVSSLGAFALDAAGAPAKLAMNAWEDFSQSTLGKALGLSEFGSKAEYEDYNATQKANLEQISEASTPATQEDLDRGFKALGEDPDYKKAAQQKQLDRLNKIDTADLTPAQVKRKAQLEQDLAPAQSAAPAGPVSTAAPQASAQMDGKSGDELNTAIDNGELNVTQEEAAAVAQNLQQQGIQNLQDLYQADMADIEKMKALAFMRLFNNNATVDARLVQEIRNVGETGERSMDTAQAVTSANALRSGELDVAKTKISAMNANTGYQSLLRSARNDDSNNVRQAATDVTGVMGNVFETAYDEGGNLVADRSTAAQIFNQYLPELDALAKSATTPEAAGIYNKTKNQALSLAIQALASDGGSGLDYFTSMFRAEASGSPRATLDNLVSDGDRVYYQEPDSKGNYRNVGNGVSLKTLTRTNPEIAKYIGDIVLQNRQARAQAG